MQATDIGVDPRALPMIAFGGAGPVHAYGVARKLGIRNVICPPGAGVTSAIGLLGAPVAADLSASLPMAVAAGTRSRAWLLDDAGRARPRSRAAAGVAGDEITFSYTVDMRHVGQGHEISVALPEGNPPTTAFLQQLLRASTTLHRALRPRGFGTEVEVITWRIRASGAKAR